ncbi:MAG: hypothetical protein HWD92_13575 [Flavobacteriia bacterium]|nr:hypothetical protein [Flavobacteriia bacterium]
MKSELGKWMQSKLNQINDRATTSDWAAMEQLINAQPALAPKSWYQTGWGLGSLIAGVAVIATVSIFTLTSSDEEVLPIADEGSVESVTPTPKDIEENPSIDNTDATSIAFDEAVESSTSSAFIEEVNDIESTQTDNAGQSIVASTQNSPIVPALDPHPVPSWDDQSILGGPDEMIADPNETQFVKLNPGPAEDQTSNESENSISGEAQELGESLASNQASSANPTENDPSTFDGSAASNGGQSTANAGAQNTGQGTHTMASNTEASSESSSTMNESGNEGVEGSENATSTSPSANTASSSQQSTTSASVPTLIDATDESRVRWSISAYGDYDLNSPIGNTSEELTTNYGNFFGAGLEVEANWRGWTMGTGIMSHRESSLFQTEQLFMDTNRHGSTWYEIDTTYHEVYDSTWVPNGGNGYWDIDTTLEARTSERMVEGYGFTYTSTLVQSRISTEGYRLSVPLLIGRRWDVNRWNFGIQAGPVFTIRSTSWFYNDDYVRSTSDRSFDLMLRAEFGYEVLPRLSLFGRAGLRTNMERIANLRQSAWTTRAVPVSLGVRYTF